MLKYLVTTTLVFMTFLFTGCDDAKVASTNLTKSADNFELVRRIIFYNGIAFLNHICPDPCIHGLMDIKKQKKYGYAQFLFQGFFVKYPDADMAECVTLSAYGHPIMILYERTAKEADRP